MSSQLMSAEATRLREDRQAAFTPERKLRALALRFYHYQRWEPQEGDFYTITRADTMLFQIVHISGCGYDIVSCRHNPAGPEMRFETFEFATEGFGINRVHVPDWIFDHPSSLDDF